MKILFAEAFGVTQFDLVDDAFFAETATAQMADSRFRWDMLGVVYTAVAST